MKKVKKLVATLLLACLGLVSIFICHFLYHIAECSLVIQLQSANVFVREYILGLSGCGAENLKDNILDGYNQWLQFSSKHALTKENKLQGKKTKGEDAYVGSYSAGYEDFDGEEYIFGGTGLEREKGNELTATYTLKITSGSASLVWIHSGSEYTITDTESKDVFEITIGSGDNYIVLKGEDFSGSLELEVK